MSSELKYQSAQDGTTHINDPSVPESDLPSGWTEEYDEDGDLYWANLDKMLATYVPVTAAAAAAAAAVDDGHTMRHTARGTRHTA